MKDSLQGNSKTIMIAAISPASINFQESINTLVYANNVKKLVTKAIINEDPQDKLIKNLKLEIENLKKQLSGKAPTAADGTAEPAANSAELKALQKKLLENEKALKLLSVSNEDMEKKNAALQAARELTLKGMGVLVDDTQDAFDRTKHLHFVNLNEDPLLSEFLIFPLRKPIITVGLPNKNIDIPISGVGIGQLHCQIKCNILENAVDQVLILFFYFFIFYYPFILFFFK